MDKITKAQVKLVRSLQQKKFRDELSLFVAEGEKCVSELRKAFELDMLIVEEGLDLNRSVFCQAKPVCILSAKRSDIEQMSGLRTPQGVIGVFKKRETSDSKLDDFSQLSIPSDRTPKEFRTLHSQLFLALDGIQDPGNLGTIIRTCDWFGVHDIFCSPDTADCFNPKVVQATMGALARVRLHYVDLPQKLSEFQNQHLAIYGTLLDGQNMYEVLNRQSSIVQSSIIVMGNEGNGISQAVRQFITHPLYIPSYPKNVETSESLNVSIATAIVLAEFRRIAV